MSPRSITLSALAQAIGATVRGATGEEPVDGVGSLDEAGPGQVAFYANPAYRKQLAGSQARAIIVSESEAALPELKGRPLLVAQTPYAAFARASQHFHPPKAHRPGIDARALVEAGAEVDPTAHVAAFAVVKAGAKVGARAALLEGSYVGENAEIGADSLLWPHVVVRDGCVVGARCILHPGVVVGADGFGFAFDPEGDGEGPIHRKIPQAGIVRLEDDVELGANTCIDRATLGETVIGRGTKLDNMVQVAHNVKIGALSVIAAQTGIAGSSTIGMGVAMGGQVGVVGHIRIGDMARLGARTAAYQDVEPGVTMLGTPAVEAKAWRRSVVALNKLPDLMREVRELRKRLGALEAAAGAGGNTDSEDV